MTIMPDSETISEVTMLESMLEEQGFDVVDEAVAQGPPRSSSENGDDNDDTSADASECTTEDKKPSNETLLGVAFISFLSFAIVQLVFSFVADSTAMLGDSVAMMVDAFTYLANWVAERQKARYIIVNERAADQSVQASELARRKRFLLLEIFPPLLSVTTLLVVTIIVLNRSIQVIMLDMHRDQSQQDNPNLNLMLIFSMCNLLLDGVNVFCFAKAKRLLGFTTVSHSHDKEANLNMCSAYTHVFADTLRSLAVIAAAGIAKAVPQVTSEVADATAALVVSVVIALSLVPLVHGLVKSVVELWGIILEERAKDLADARSIEVEIATPYVECEDR
jgi:Co/Zn/Cd efflux system component